MTEGEIAEHHYKLGRILWTMGGSLRDEPTQARAHFEAASREECDSQARTQTPHITASRFEHRNYRPGHLTAVRQRPMYTCKPEFWPWSVTRIHCLKRNLFKVGHCVSGVYHPCAPGHALAVEWRWPGL